MSSVQASSVAHHHYKISNAIHFGIKALLSDTFLN